MYICLCRQQQILKATHLLAFVYSTAVRIAPTGVRGRLAATKAAKANALRKRLNLGDEFTKFGETPGCVPSPSLCLISPSALRLVSKTRMLHVCVGELISICHVFLVRFKLQHVTPSDFQCDYQCPAFV